jgi:hypothetical protein
MLPPSSMTVEVISSSVALDVLVIAYLPLDPRFAGSYLAEDDGF